jgi:hypothetical protein
MYREHFVLQLLQRNGHLFLNVEDHVSDPYRTSRNKSFSLCEFECSLLRHAYIMKGVNICFGNFICNDDIYFLIYWICALLLKMFSAHFS